jgi:hypothetical protein
VRDEVTVDHGLHVAPVVRVEALQLAHHDVDHVENVDLKGLERLVERGTGVPARPLR